MADVVDAMMLSAAAAATAAAVANVKAAEVAVLEAQAKLRATSAAVVEAAAATAIAVATLKQKEIERDTANGRSNRLSEHARALSDVASEKASARKADIAAKNNKKHDETTTVSKEEEEEESRLLAPTTASALDAGESGDKKTDTPLTYDGVGRMALIFRCRTLGVALEDIPIKRDEIIELLNRTKKTRRASSSVDQSQLPEAPASPQEDESPLVGLNELQPGPARLELGLDRKPEWLYGIDMKKSAGEELLKRNGLKEGAFLCRVIKSKTPEDPAMVLMVAHRKAVTSHKLKMDKKGNVVIGRFKPMPVPEGSKTLAGLIEFLSQLNLSRPEAMKQAPSWPIELTSGVRPNGTLMDPKWSKDNTPAESPVRRRSTGGRKSVQWAEDSDLDEIIVSPRQTRYNMFQDAEPGGIVKFAGGGQIQKEFEYSRYVALRSFTHEDGASFGDLVFEKGEILRVYNEGGPGGLPADCDGIHWLQGWDKNNIEGAIPSNYVKRIVEDEMSSLCSPLDNS